MALGRAIKAVIKVEKKTIAKATDTFDRKITSEAGYGERPVVKLQLRAKEAPAALTVNQLPQCQTPLETPHHGNMTYHNVTGCT